MVVILELENGENLFFSEEEEDVVMFLVVSKVRFVYSVDKSLYVIVCLYYF